MGLGRSWGDGAGEGHGVAGCCNLTLKFLALPFQKRQLQSNSESQSEKFNPHPEEVASGFPIDPPRPSQAAETGVGPQGPPHKRASHSGPLTNRAAWMKNGKRLDDKILSVAQYQVSSGAVMGRGLPSDDREELSINLQPEVPKLIRRFQGSFKEATEALRQNDQMHHMQGAFHDKEENTNKKDSILVRSLTSATVSCSCSSKEMAIVYTKKKEMIIADFGFTHSHQHFHSFL